MKQKRGQLWVLDGVDGVGKATQAELLVKQLKSSSRLTHHISFPHYQEKPWGVLTRQYLDGVFGSLEETGPYAASLLYAGDRARHAQAMNETLERGEWIVCDRFTPANAAFQSAKIETESEQERFIQWLFKTEYELFGIPKPDGVIVLTMPVSITHQRTEERRDEARNRGDALNDKVSHADIHEQNAHYMHKAMRQYEKLAMRFDWHIVECVSGEKVLTREEIADKIWQIIRAEV